MKYTRKVQRKDFLEEGKYPIVSQEADFISGYWDDAADVFRVTTPLVIFGDHTKALKYVDFDFVLGADGVKVLVPKPFLLPKYSFYHLLSAPLESLGYSRHYRLLKELEVACSSLEEQIVIAATFDRLAAERRRLDSIYRRKVTALDELKKSLLHRAFTGQLGSA